MSQQGCSSGLTKGLRCVMPSSSCTRAPARQPQHRSLPVSGTQQSSRALPSTPGGPEPTRGLPLPLSPFGCDPGTREQPGTPGGWQTACSCTGKGATGQGPDRTTCNGGREAPSSLFVGSIRSPAHPPATASQPVGKTLRCARQSSARLRELLPGRNAGHRAEQPRTARRPGDPLLRSSTPGAEPRCFPSPSSPGEEDDAVLHRAAAHPPPALPDQLLLRARQHPALHSGAGKSPPGEPAPVPAARGSLRTQRGRQRSGARNGAEPPALRPPPCPRAPPAGRYRTELPLGHRCGQVPLRRRKEPLSFQGN